MNAGKKKAEEPEEVIRIRKAFNESLRFSGFVPSEDPLFIPVSWHDSTLARPSATIALG